MVETFIPVNLTFDDDIMLYFMRGYFFFWLSYFRFWTDLTCVTLSLIPFFTNRVYLHGDPLDDTLLSAVVLVPWHLFNLYFIHLIITKMGFLFIDAQVQRHGNEKVLDSLDEGVLILE